jgi:hypothetical protein
MIVHEGTFRLKHSWTTLVAPEFQVWYMHTGPREGYMA